MNPTPSTLPLRVVLVGTARTATTSLPAEETRFAVTHHARLPDALRALGSTNPVSAPRCVVLEVPDAADLAALRAVRELVPDVPIVAVLPLEEAGDGARAVRAGALEVVAAGAGPEALVRAVLLAVERRRSGEHAAVQRLVRDVAAGITTPAEPEERGARAPVVLALVAILVFLALELVFGGGVADLSTLLVFPVALVAARAGRGPAIWVAVVALVGAASSHVVSAEGIELLPLGVQILILFGVAAIADGGRKRAEEHARLLRTVIDGTTEAITVRDLDGRYVVVNEAFARLVRHPREAIIGRQPSELIDAETAAGWDASHRAVLAAGEPRRHVYTMNVPGGLRQYAVVKSPLRTTDGDLSGVIMSARDETLVRKLEADSTRVFDLVPDLLARFDARGGLQQANGAWTTILGWTDEELRSRPLPTFVHPDDIPEATTLWRGGEGVAIVRMAARSGGWRAIEWTITRDDDFVVGAGRDVTERVELRRALTEGDQRFRSLVGALRGTFVAMFDHDLRYTFADGEAFDLVGLDRRVLGRSLHEVIPHRAREFAPRYRAALAGEDQRFVTPVRGGRTFAVHIGPVRDADGVVVGGMLICQDITPVTLEAAA